ncbi:MAG: hypothetical protein FJ146_05555 [Deltaproteobacteria bacterium]|nr:hypothetical protein [Deltaproteobacteria bacterium]
MKRFALMTLLGIAPLSGCGAPSKSAASVSALFSQPATLQGTLTPLCKYLRERTEAPSVKDLTMQIGDCPLAGEGAQNYAGLTTFRFVNADGTALGDGTPVSSQAEASKVRSSNPEDPKVIYRAYRAQVWLNRSILDLAGVLSSFMKNNKNAAAGEVKLPESELSKLKNLATTKVTLAKPPVLDMDNLTLDASIEIEMSGIVKAYQQIDISGQLFENTFAVVARSNNGVPYAKSILHSIETVVLFTPFAGDTYVDVFMAINMYDFGVSSIIDSQMGAILGTVMKGTLDSVLAVRANS